MNRTPFIVVMGVLVVGVLIGGCVSLDRHHETLADLAETCKVSSHSAVAFERYKHDAERRIAELEEEQARLAKQYVAARHELTQLQTDLQSVSYHLTHERDARRKAEAELADWAKRREVLESRVKDLQGRLQAREAQLDQGTEVRAEGRARVEILTEQRGQLANELLSVQTAAAQSQERLAAMEAKIASERAGREEAERRLSVLEEATDKLRRLEAEIRRERDTLRAQLLDVTARLEASREVLLQSEQALNHADDRIAALEWERTKTKAELTEAKTQTKRLKAALDAERETWASLQEVLRKVERPPQVDRRK